MNFLGMGLLEILVILFIAFIVLGPERMVEASRKAGRLMSDLRRMNSGLRETLTMDEPPQRPGAPGAGNGGEEFTAAAQDAPVDFRAWRAERAGHGARTSDPGERGDGDGPAPGGPARPDEPAGRGAADTDGERP